MRQLLFIVAGFLILIFISCKKNATTAYGTAIPLYSCNNNSSDRTVPYICFDSLINDSRCPEDAVCIWAGYVMIKTTFHENGNTHSFRMILPDLKNFGAVNDTTINGYRVVFKDLMPYPNTRKPAPLPVDIKATIVIIH